MKIAFQDFGDSELNTFVGGETRWAINWIHFLRRLGHDVEIFPITASPDVDLFFSWDTCEHIVDKPHVHNHFSPCNNNLLEILPCYQKHGTTIISNPYPAAIKTCIQLASQRVSPR